MMREMIGVIWWRHKKECIVKGEVDVCQKGAGNFMKQGYKTASHKSFFQHLEAMSS